MQHFESSRPPFCAPKLLKPLTSELIPLQLASLYPPTLFHRRSPSPRVDVCLRYLELIKTAWKGEKNSSVHAETVQSVLDIKDFLKGTVCAALISRRLVVSYLVFLPHSPTRLPTAFSPLSRMPQHHHTHAITLHTPHQVRRGGRHQYCPILPHRQARVRRPCVFLVSFARPSFSTFLTQHSALNAPY